MAETKDDKKSEATPPPPPPAVIENDESNDEKEATEQTNGTTTTTTTTKGDDDDDADADASEFLRNLTILPPLQKSDVQNPNKDGAVVGGAVPLPPIRAEEPVSSLRAALGEVKGYAHMTNYRFVLENRTNVVGVVGVEMEGSSGAAEPTTPVVVVAVDGTEATTTTAAASQQQQQQQQQQHQHHATGQGGGGGGGKKNKKKKSKGSQKATTTSGAVSGSAAATPSSTSSSSPGSDIGDVISPYTGVNAVVSAPSAVRSLASREPTDPSPIDTKGKAAVIEPDEETKKEEIVLDDYGDLTPLLERGLQSGSSFRIVLERYDVAGVKDHVVRLRSLLEGNAPSVTSLVEEGGGEEGQKDEGTKEKTTAQGTEGKKDEESKDEKSKKYDKQTPDATTEDDIQKDSSSDGKQKHDKDDENDTKPETDDNNSSAEREEHQKKLRESARKSHLSAVAKKMPSFPLDQPVAVDGTDLEGYYYLSCGEEEALQALREGINADPSSLDDADIVKTDAATKPDKVKRTKKKKKRSNNKSSSAKSKDPGASSSDKEHASDGTTENDTTDDDDNANDESDSNSPAEKKRRLRERIQLARRLNDLESITKVQCTIRYSGFHPPPPHRRLLGDLAYLEVTVPNNSDGGEEGIVHVTAVPTGFYVNRTSLVQTTAPGGGGGGGSVYRFNPAPAKEACFSHELLDCLLRRSKSLRSAWANALSASKERADLSSTASATDTPLQALHRVAVRGDYYFPGSPNSGAAGVTHMSASSGGIDSVILRPSWLVPVPRNTLPSNKSEEEWHNPNDNLHEYNPNRTEEDLTCTFGLDIRGGSLRDWNEELQSAREMPVADLQERIDRARMVHKVLTDFGEAALIGALAIFDGHVTPMNPNEPTRSHVYLHNSIFFSRAVDAGVDTFKVSRGDRAARKSASRDAQCMGTLHRLDVSGLYTLATVLVDYLGTRLVCQSIVPGILHGEKTHTLLYGAVEATAPLSWDQGMHELLEGSVGKALMVASRPVPTLPLSEERMEEIERLKTVLPLPLVAALEKERRDEKKEDDAEPKPTTVICGPVEAKGIKGSDQRRYVLDLTRLTPRDANWVPKSKGGTGNWEAVMQTESSSSSSNGKSKKGSSSMSHYEERLDRFVPKSVDDEEWTMAVLRQELVTGLTHKKMAEWLGDKKKRKAQLKEAQSKEEDENSKKDSSEKDATQKNKDDKSEDKPEAETGSDGNGPEAKAKANDSEATNDDAEEDDKSNSKSTKKPSLNPVDEKHLESLRFNLNVFLPNTKSLSEIDPTAHEQLLKDEELVREAAIYLWDVILPKLTRELRDNSGPQLPVDGRSLSELLHRRGINCRYLGRLAMLASEEEAKDRKAERDIQSGIISKLPRRVMPLCWLELLECEMVARAAKHVLDGYLTENGGSAGTVPVQTVASFLSALVSTGEESAAETEVRLGKEEKNAKQGSLPDEEDMNGLSVFDVGGDGDAIPPPIRGRAEVWEDIEREVGRRFRYVLTLYNAAGSAAQSGNAASGNKEQASRALYIPLLRRVCQRTGVRLVARNYAVGGKCLCSSGNSSGGRTTISYPISPIDILDIIPLVKHAAAHGGEGFVPSSFSSTAGGGGIGTSSSAAPSLHILLPDAKAALEAAHVHWNARVLPQAMDLAQEAASLYQRVVDTPLHAAVGQCLDLTAVILFQAQEPELAAANASRALAVAVQLGGFDCSEAVTAHTTLSHILVSSGGMAGGVQHLRSALYLMELMAGRNYAELANVYHKLGTIYYEVGSGINALRFYQEASARKNCDRMVEGMVAKSAALVLAALGQFKAALDSERRAHGLYRLILGEENDLTKNSANTVKQFMSLAIEQGTRLVAEEQKRKEERAADAMASQIEADETEAEEKDKQKKRKNKTKKKKK